VGGIVTGLESLNDTSLDLERSGTENWKVAAGFFKQATIQIKMLSIT
jgi:hypothetical protein